MEAKTSKPLGIVTQSASDFQSLLPKGKTAQFLKKLNQIGIGLTVGPRDADSFGRSFGLQLLEPD